MGDDLSRISWPTVALLALIVALGIAIAVVFDAPVSVYLLLALMFLALAWTFPRTRGALIGGE